MTLDCLYVSSIRILELTKTVQELFSKIYPLAKKQ